MTAALGLVAPFLLATTKKTSSTNPTLFIFIAIAAAFYFLIYRPQQRKAKMAREVTKNYDVGDEVLTAGGIVGHIIDIDGDRVTLETSVGASFVVLKQYVLRKLEDPGSTDAGELSDAGELPEADEHDGADAHDADDDPGHDASDASDSSADEADEADEADASAPEADPAPSNRSRRVRRAKGSDTPNDDGGPDGPPII
jgi:preprotein translocase YajC subunit